MMGFGGMNGFGLFGGLLALIINVGVIVGIVALIFWAVRKFSSGGSNMNLPWNQTSQSQSPRDILQTRYASGEITREQFQQMNNDLA